MVNMAILQLTIVTSLVLGALCQAPCTQTSACTCALNGGMVVDLTPLKDQRFDVLDPSGKNKYDIQFCQTFSFNNSACQDVYGCQFNPLSGGQYISIGKHVTFNHTELITLRDGDRTTVIGIYCSPLANDSFTFLTEDPANTFKFQLNSTYACQVQEPTTPATTSTSTANTTQTSTSTSTANTTSTTATTTTTPSNTTHTTSNTTASTVTTKTTSSSNSTSTTSQTTSTSTKTTSTSTVTTKSSPKTATTAASKTTKKGKANSFSSATVGVLMLVACITRSLF